MQTISRVTRADTPTSPFRGLVSVTYTIRAASSYLRSVALATGLLLIWGMAMADAHDASKPMPQKYDTELSAELQAFLDTYAEAYNRQDYAALLRMWDQDYPHPIYMAEEIDPPMHGWSLLNAYFNPKPGVQVLDGIWNGYTDVRAHYLADDLAMATYKLTYHIKVKRQKAMSSWDRVLAVFRKTGDGWKLTAYAEAPMSPLTMVRKMLQKAVPDDFDEYLDTQQ
ncbi:MAG: nuclear transport factor 2 family protein [Gammaproteobacteria bacterium]|nr:MAG: nuclear transport factor 2 family protein [Gammaproteobacteria bacterium]